MVIYKERDECLCFYIVFICNDEVVLDCQGHILSLYFTELRLLQERERSAKKIQAMRTTCQNLVLNMAKTVKEYFKKTIEDTRRQHRKELERARRDGIQEGMRRQRRILQKAMVRTIQQRNLF